MQPIEEFECGSLATRQNDSGWSEAKEIAHCYLMACGIASSRSRAILIDDAFTHLETANRSLEPRVRTMRMLASLERVLSRHLGSPQGDNAEAAAGRLLFSIDPSFRARLDDHLHPRNRSTALVDGGFGLVRIPEIDTHRRMPRQTIRFRTIPLVSAIKRLFSRRRPLLRA